METPTKVIFPYFEKGNPLRSRDLNAVFRRAEEEVRHTRTCLQGVGIFYGLHANRIANTIKVQAGAGVTSAGYLYCTHEDIVLTHKLEKESALYQRQFSTEPFGVFLDAPAASDAEKKQTSIQAIHLGIVGDGMVPLTAEDLKDKRLLVFFEVSKVSISGCATCEKGSRADLVTEFLLVDKANWDKLPLDPQCKNTPTGSATNSFDPKLLSLPRFGLLDKCIHLDGDDTLLTGYKKSIDTAFETIKAEVAKIARAADGIFNASGETAASALALPALTSLNAQYVHDYLRLLIRAYNEFVATPFSRNMAGLPPETCFPKHLVLGIFDGAGKLTDQERTLLYRPPFDDASDADFDYARKLYERLISLLQNADFGRLITLMQEGEKTLRITPSRQATFSIGRQAIPFYLKADEVRKTWRPAAKFPELILSYDDTKRLQNQPFFDESDFYRIEGHVGQKLTQNDGKNQVEFLRDCLNLPFQLIVVTAKAEPENLKNNRLSLSEFAQQNPGLEHQGGVPSGGTFVVILENSETNVIVGDLCLPYWVQPPIPKPVVADFEIVDQKFVDNGETFVFENTSTNYDDIEWRVNKGDGTLPGDHAVNTDKFTFTFPITKLPVTHYLVTLTAKKDGRESVEKITIVIIHKEKVELPPKADFDIEEKDHVESIEVDGTNTIQITIPEAPENLFTIRLVFVNLSEDADGYIWQVNDDNKQINRKSKSNFVHDFSWTHDEIKTGVSRKVSLTALKTGQLSDEVHKDVKVVITQDQGPL